MEETKRTSMVIGAETEYGVLVSGDSNLGYEKTILSILTATDEVSDLGKVKRELSGIEDMEEHEKIENFENEGGQSASWEQRRGKTGYVLECGGRYYIDMCHPEFSIPECATPLDAVLWQKAGDFFVNRCRVIAENKTGQKIGIFKNNSAGKGKSYAAHENYSLNPKTFEKIFHRQVGYPQKGEFGEIFLNFLISRQIITGAGKVWMEKEGQTFSDRSVSYQISQRADFLCHEIGGSTTGERPIINTRDYPYADHNLCRRLHVICGDGNMSELSLYMKFGITAVFLRMLQDWEDFQEEPTFLHTALENPPIDIKRVSRDLSLKLKLDFVSGMQKTAVEMQYEFLRLAKKFRAQGGLPRWADDVLEKWEEILKGFLTNPFSHHLARNLDWILKKRILNQFERKTGTLWEEDAYKDRDIQYHNIDPELSYFSLYEKGWEVFRLLGEDQIQRAAYLPPTNTRAYLRGEIIKKFRKDLRDIGWDYIDFKNPSVYLFLADPRWGGQRDTGDILKNSRNAGEFVEKVKNISSNFIKVHG